MLPEQLMSEEVGVPRMKCCPFCGKVPNLYIFMQRATVRCACGVWSADGGSKMEAVTAWNARAEDVRMERARELLLEALPYFYDDGPCQSGRFNSLRGKCGCLECRVRKFLGASDGE